MTTNTLISPETTPAPTDFEDNLDHIFCMCLPNLSLCGVYLADEELDFSEWEPDENTCSMCLEEETDDLETCKRCR